jgi:hypothetical protein
MTVCGWVVRVGGRGMGVVGWVGGEGMLLACFMRER